MAAVLPALQGFMVEDRGGISPQGGTGKTPKERAKQAGHLLKHGRRREREEAARLLGSLGEAAIDQGCTLAYALEDEGEEVRVAVAAAIRTLIPMLLKKMMGSMVRLSEAPSPLRSALVEILGSNDPEARKVAAETLIVFGEAALPQLVEALRDKNPQRQLACAALVGGLHRNCTERTAIAVDTAVAELNHADVAVRAAAVAALGQLGELAASAAGAVAAIVLSPKEDLQVKCSAAAAIGEFGSAAAPYRALACEFIGCCLCSCHSVVRLAAAKAAGSLGEAAKPCAELACKVALAGLWDDCWEVRAAAAEAIGGLGGVAAGCADALAAKLGDDIALVQCAASAALGRLGSAASRYLEEACDVASLSLDSDVALVRVAAALAVGFLGDVAAPHARRACKVLACEFEQGSVSMAVVARSLQDMGVAAAPYLQGANLLAAASLRKEDPLVRLAAADALGSLDHARGKGVGAYAASVAADQLSSSDWHARVEASKALAEAGPDGLPHVEVIARALKDSRAEVRKAAGAALVGMGRVGLGYLAVAMRDVDWKARLAAAKALEEAGYDASPHVSINAMRNA